MQRLNKNSMDYCKAITVWDHVNYTNARITFDVMESIVVDENENLFFNGTPCGERAEFRIANTVTDEPLTCASHLVDGVKWVNSTVTVTRVYVKKSDHELRDLWSSATALAFNNDVWPFVRDGQKIAAIKRIREYVPAFSLLDAKRLYEMIEQDGPPADMSTPDTQLPDHIDDSNLFKPPF